MAGIFGHCDNCRTMLKNDLFNPVSARQSSPAASLQTNAGEPGGPGGPGGGYCQDLALSGIIHQEIKREGGWIGFDAFMSLALYTPGLGYYANGSAKFGLLPAGAMRSRVAGHNVGDQGTGLEGSDFATAPEMTPLFGQTLAAQVAHALQATQTAEVWEFGAGSGALAAQILDELARLNVPLARYNIVELSGALRERQQHALRAHAGKAHWVDALPAQMQGIVVGNEVLDAMPVKLLVRNNGTWFERGVALGSVNANAHANANANTNSDQPTLAWADRPTHLRPPLDVPGDHDYLTEIHPQAEAFIRTLADRLTQGAAFFLDYGFPQGEYYHPQRHMGTVMCHRQHRSDANPLADVGLKDITAHVNFTGIALAAQDAGLEVLGYCTQARFLMNCGLLERLEAAPFAEKVMAQKLILEHEMGELFKVMGVWKPGSADKPGGKPWQPAGFAQGDRTHTL
jgi:SAM-dependent MidA family methyltransferase